LNTPVAFIIFNRPDRTERVFAEIARARPAKLLVVADGPRPDRPGEREACLAARSVIDRIDWPCEVLTNFAESNLGCKRRVSSGIDWVFDQVEEAIIFEDDCLPHPSFFRFCEELLEKYRDDERIMAISGDNFQQRSGSTPYSYSFSRYLHIWGWASWRRAWQHYDVEMKLWPSIRDGVWLQDLLGYKTVAEYWQRTFDEVVAGQISTWDYQWLFACWTQNALSIAPNVNLVSNIGFGSDSTHTTRFDAAVAGLSTAEMSFPLRHPPYVIRDREADDFESQHLFKCALDDVGLQRGLRQHLAALITPQVRKTSLWKKSDG
jgi:hypothetical protein